LDRGGTVALLVAVFIDYRAFQAYAYPFYIGTMDS